MELSGTVTTWNQQDGYGLVENPEPVPNGIQPFVDESIVGRSLDLEVGDEIEYRLGQDSRGWLVVDILRVEGDAV